MSLQAIISGREWGKCGWKCSLYGAQSEFWIEDITDWTSDKHVSCTMSASKLLIYSAPLMSPPNMSLSQPSPFW